MDQMLEMFSKLVECPTQSECNSTPKNCMCLCRRRAHEKAPDGKPSSGTVAPDGYMANFQVTYFHMSSALSRALSMESLKRL